MKRLLGICTLLSLIFLSCLPLVHSQETYTLIIKAVDHTEQPLSGAFVQVTYMFRENEPPTSTFPKQTNASGFVEFTIESIETSANITVAWLGVEVAFQGVNLSPGTNFFTITCDVSELSVLTLDGNGLPLQGAQVNLDLTDDWPPSIPNSSTTNDQGLAVFPQMPYFSYPVSVKWQGKLVHEGTFNLTSSETSYTADCNVYDLTVNVVDKEDRPISGAKVLISRDDEWKASKLTNYGTAIFTQLAFGNYSIEASYESSSNTTTAQLAESTEVNLHLNITYSPRTFEITVRAVWSDGKPASGANVIILDSLGDTVSSGVTDDSGYFIDLLTEGEYVLNVSKNDLSKVENVTLGNNVMITLSFNAARRTYTLTVEVTGENGAPAEGALVEVYSNGSVIFTSETINGVAFFNLQEGTYRVIVSTGDEQREKTVELGEDATISITFQKGVASELMLFILAVLGVLAAIILVTCARRLTTSKEA